jgi:hypothetical protein
MEVTTRERTLRFTVAAEQFTATSWVATHVGANAIIYPGQIMREDARAAIQFISGDVPKRIVYAHIGWRKIGEGSAFIHADGRLGPHGPLSAIELSLPEPLSSR